MSLSQAITALELVLDSLDSQVRMMRKCGSLDEIVLLERLHKILKSDDDDPKAEKAIQEQLFQDMICDFFEDEYDGEISFENLTEFKRTITPFIIETFE